MLKTIKKILGENIRDFRRSRRLPNGKVWSQGYLAERCDAAITTIQRIEAGEAWPSYETLELIARVLNVDPTELFFSPQSMSPKQALEVLTATVSAPWMDSKPKLLTAAEPKATDLDAESLKYAKKIAQLPPEERYRLTETIDAILEDIEEQAHSRKKKTHKRG